MVVEIPCPNETVSNLQPWYQLIDLGLPTSSISNCILFNIPIFSKNNLKFSGPIFWAILTDPTFPYLIKICSAVKSEGISSLYSPILCLSHFIDLGKSKNSVSGSIKSLFNALAKVKGLKTEPSS